MPILVTCECGRQLRARDDLAGRRAKCPGCGMLLLVQGPPYGEGVPVLEEDDDAGMPQRPTPVRPIPAIPIPAQPIPAQPLNPLEQLAYAGSTTPDPEPLVHHDQRPLPVIARAPEEVERLERSWRGNLFWLLLLAMIPLAWMVFVPPKPTLDRIRQTLAEHPDVAHKFNFSEEMELEEFHEMLDALPGKKINGALLGRYSVWPILMGLASIAIFVAVIKVALAAADVSAKEIFLTGLFTGTAGVVLLITAQLSGSFCCIGAFYLAAEHPDATFGASLIGFVFGIGFLEETTKCLPILWKLYRRMLINWRAAAVVGMASGAGFGVSEALLYAFQDYNGLEPAATYFVRFLSCVALHATLSGACAIMIQRKQEHLVEDMDFINWTMTLMAIIFVPIFLHGLYNTLSKKEMEIPALLVSVAAFGWMWWMIKSARGREKKVVLILAAGPQIVRTAKGTRFIMPPPPLP